MKKKLFAFIMGIVLIISCFSFVACGNSENNDMPKQLQHHHEHFQVYDVWDKCGWECLYRSDSGDVGVMAKEGNASAEYYGETVSGYGLSNPLVSVYVSGKVKKIGDKAFKNKDDLEVIKFDEGLIEIGEEAFAGSTGDTYRDANYSNNVQKLVIPDSVESIGNDAFRFCRSLKSVTLGKGVTSIGGGAFFDCYFLETITIHNKVQGIGNSAFGECDNLKKINYMGSLNEWLSIEGLKNIMYNGSHGKKLYINNELVKNIELKNIAEIQPYAFANCGSLESVTIGADVRIIGEYAFRYCDNLKKVIFNDPAGWYGSDGNRLTRFTVTDLSEPKTAVSFLTKKYESNLWTKF